MNAKPKAEPIIIFSGVRGDTRRYRTLHLYEQLRLAGVDCALSHLTDPQLPDLLRTASAAVMHRVAYDGYVDRLFRILRQRNALVLLDADDYLYDPEMMRWIDSPDFQDPVRASLYRQEMLRHRQTLDRCDAVTVSTDYLAGMISTLGRPVRVHRNAYSLEMLSLSDRAFEARPRPAGRVVIGYASGTRTHDKDFALVRPILCDVMERYPQVDLWLMGVIDPGEGWGALQERVRTFPFVPWRALPGRLAGLDINLAPLVAGNPFNESKSEIKFMEAALVRVPTIASRTDAFAYAVRPGETGLLASSPEEWRSALEMLVQNEDARRSIGLAAYQDVLVRYAPLARGQAMRELLTEVAAKAGKRAPGLDAAVAKEPPFLFTPQDEKSPTMLDLARYSILHRGLPTLLGQVWVFFRRLLAPLFPFRGTRTI